MFVAGQRGARAAPPTPRTAVVLVAVLAFAGAVATADDHPDPWHLDAGERSLLLDVYTMQDGLPQNTVVDLERTRDGFLWVATFGGLARFDGRAFEIFDAVATPGVGGMRFVALHEASDGTLWAAIEEGGLVRLRNGRFATLPPGQGAPDRPVRGFVETGDGTLWMVTTHGIGVWEEPGGFRDVDLPAALDGRISRGVWIEDGVFWIATLDGGLYRVEDGRARPVHDFGNGAKTDAEVRDVHRDADGTLWAAGARGTWSSHDGTTWTLRSADPSWALAPRRSGGLWVAGPGLAAIGRVEDGSLDLVPVVHGERRFAVDAVVHDSDGHLWLGTRGGGLIHLRRRPVMRHGTGSDVEAPGVKVVAGVSGEPLWVGTECEGLMRFHEGRFERAAIRAPSPIRCVDALAFDARGGTWIAHDDRISRVVRGAVSDTVEIGFRVRALVATRDRGVVAPLEPGLATLRPEGPAPLPGDAGHWQPDDVLVLRETRDGAIWVGGKTGLARYDGGEYRRFGPDDGFPQVSVRDVRETANGTIWIATYGGGLVRFRDGRFLRLGRRVGLPDPFLSSIAEDVDGNLWINGNRGVTVIPRTDLADLDAGRLSRLAPLLLGPEDGGAEGTGGFQPAGWLAPDGRLWLPSVDGLLEIDTRTAFAPVDAPRVHVTAVEVDGEPVPAGMPIEVPPSRPPVLVRFTAPDFRHPGQLRFRVRLDGDAEWTDLGGAREARYARLPPGDRTVSIQARRAGSPWGEDLARVRLYVRVPPWTLWWVQAIAALVVLGIVVIVGQRRLRTARRRNLELRTEIEQRRRTEARLRDSEARLAEAQAQIAAIVRNSPVVLFALDAGGRVTLVDGKGLDRLGLEREDLVGRSLIEVARERGVPTENLDAVLRGEPRSWVFRTRSVAFDTHATPLYADDGEVVGAIGVATDITERMRVEEERAQLLAELHQSQRLDAVGKLAGGIAHEFNNILTIIGTHAELLTQESGGGSEDVAGHVRRILGAKDSAASLTRQLLAFGRRQLLKPESIDLNAFARRAHGTYRRILEERIDLRLDLRAEGCWVRADPVQIEQILVNLLINARDAMPEGGAVWVRTGEVEVSADARSSRERLAPGRYAVLEVEDEGVGMSPEVQARVFEPFFTTKKVGIGVGLGLSTVFGIVRQSGGDVRVTSAPGKGSRFTVRLPAARPEERRERPVATREPASLPGGDETVLVVEDEPEVRGVLVDMLSELGYRVLSAKDGVEGESVVRETEGPIDLLISDIVMPGKDGVRLAETFLSVRPGSRAMLITGYADGNVPDREAVSDVPVLHKPFQLHELVRMVRDLLDGIRRDGSAGR